MKPNLFIFFSYELVTWVSCPSNQCQNQCREAFLFCCTLVYAISQAFSYSLSIFKTVVLRSLSSVSAYWSVSGTDSVGLLFSFQWTIFSYFFVCLLILFFFPLEHWTSESNNVIALEIFPLTRVWWILLVSFCFLLL